MYRQVIYHVFCLIVSFTSVLSFVISFPIQLVFPAVCLPVAGSHSFFTEFYSFVYIRLWLSMWGQTALRSFLCCGPRLLCPAL